MWMKQALKPVSLALIASGLMSISVPSMAGERESLEQLRTTTLTLIDMLVKEGVLSKANADNLVKQAEAAKQANNEPSNAEQADASKTADGVVRVQYVPDVVKNKLREDIKKELMADLNYKAGERLGIPDWIDRISFTGDLRLRYERNNFSDLNTTSSGSTAFVLRTSDLHNRPINNSLNDRELYRLRARLGANIKFTDWLDGGIQITTGSVSNPVSPNQTLENQDSGANSAKFSFALDRAYLRAKPYSWLSVSGGRFANPFFSTDLVWDPDLAFDGISASFNPKFNQSWSGFGTIGAFPIDEVQSSDLNLASDKWLYALQGGIQWQSPNSSTIKLAAAIYDFKNIEGKANNLDGQDSRFNDSVMAFRQGGNSTFDIHRNGATSCGTTANNGCGLASQFRELNINGQVDLATFDPVRVVLTGDYVKNLGYDEQDIITRTGLANYFLNNPYKGKDKAYQVRLAVGMKDTYKRGDWQVFGAYKYIGADSVVDAFTDSDFHLGGTDAKGWVMGGSYGLDKNVWTSLRWFSSDQISGPPLAIDVLLLDLNARF